MFLVFLSRLDHRTGDLASVLGCGAIHAFWLSGSVVVVSHSDGGCHWLHPLSLFCDSAWGNSLVPALIKAQV